MTDIEAKALALVNEVGEERMGMLAGHINREITTHEALCRAIEQHEALYSRMMQFRGANQALRLGLYGIIDSDDADTIATTLEAGGEVDWSKYPEGTHSALGHCE